MTRAALSQSQVLTAIADFAEVFLDADRQTAYATVEVHHHRETWKVRSVGFKRWLTRRFFECERKPPGAQALADALGAIEARAQFDGNVRSVAVRVAEHGDAIYLDLADDGWGAVEVTAAGWRIVSDPPVRFRRPRGMLPLPRPVPGGSLLALRRFTNVESKEQWVLLVAWLIAALRPRGPYPVLALNGEHGSAKSTTAEVARRLVDPNVAALRAEPGDVRDVMIAASNGWMVALDNVSSLPAWFSDALCRLSTGGGFGTRELYSDGEETLFVAQRPVIVNGIEEVILRPDLVDRALLLTLPAIPDKRRRPTAAFWRDFDAAAPGLLGALLDAASTALRRIGTVRIARLPRMADFAQWVVAAEPALGWPAGRFLAAYTGNRAEAHELALDSSPVGTLVRELAPAGWIGTATELLDNLNARASEALRRVPAWPKSPRALSGALNRVAPNLRAVGVVVVFHNSRPRSIQIGKAADFATLAALAAGEDAPEDATDATDARIPTLSNEREPAAAAEEIEL